jgi:hypothetical protein
LTAREPERIVERGICQKSTRPREEEPLDFLP